jgi:hypothetical protein
MLQAEIHRSKFLIILLINNDLPLSQVLFMHAHAFNAAQSQYVHTKRQHRKSPIFEVAVVMTQKGRC